MQSAGEKGASVDNVGADEKYLWRLLNRKGKTWIQFITQSTGSIADFELVTL